MGAPEQLVQKTHMITCQADEMYEIVKRVHCMLPLSYQITSLNDFGWLCGLELLLDPSKFTPRRHENEKLTLNELVYNCALTFVGYITPFLFFG